ncbi:signal transduction histidine kinase [Chitinophaga polysaccharea]|uniref:histidine kinase n=1 Tax=Chitinophaga polysaccharea TaxID=1293035 RepID=A0A561Q4I5_9BACT|nr:hybrid sensor histidine kinase/response regulator [Chitinophaga polysaccharea]TWF45282.1 signal transduction histidine kinase [Chitinophaga polysaccharea]
MMAGLHVFRQLAALGTRDQMLSNEERKVVQLVNTLALVTGGFAITIGPVLYFWSGELKIFIPAMIEATLFAIVLLLNYYHRHTLAASIMIATQNLAAVYFGMMFSQRAPIQLLTLCLVSVTLFVFKRRSLRITGIIIAFLCLAILEFNDFTNIVQPIHFTGEQQHLIRWLAMAVILLLNVIIVLFYVTQNDQQTTALKHASHYKSLFLRETNHDINNPLNVIYGILQHYLPQAEKPDQPSVEVSPGHIRTMYAATRSIIDVVGNVLLFSKIEAGNYDKIEVSEIAVHSWLGEITEMYNELAGAKQINISLKIATQTPAVIISDRVKLTRIISNLLANAIKFSPNGADIRLEAGVWEARLQIKIADRGKGISPEKLKNLFDSPFVSERNDLIEGTGIGLTIVKQLTDTLEGTIQVESTPGTGTTFTLRIPVTVPEVPQVAEAVMPEEAISCFPNKSVLVVEDNPMSQMIANMHLKRLGCTPISFAATCKEGVRLAREQVPDLILLDIQLPDCNGLELLSILKSDPVLREVPVVVVSGDNSEDLSRQMLDSGAAGYITKPIELKALSNLLSAYFG